MHFYARKYTIFKKKARRLAYVEKKQYLCRLK